mmetsp:Transcript_54533/g.137676  ORF Transcript_54533/g.137676 Transcript_54533/m.137676 type:complete len:237 (+) Transcript_54533:653-1363(+)
MYKGSCDPGMKSQAMGESTKVQSKSAPSAALNFAACIVIMAELEGVPCTARTRGRRPSRAPGAGAGGSSGADGSLGSTSSPRACSASAAAQRTSPSSSSRAAVRRSAARAASSKPNVRSARAAKKRTRQAGSSRKRLRNFATMSSAPVDCSAFTMEPNAALLRARTASQRTSKSSSAHACCKRGVASPSLASILMAFRFTLGAGSFRKSTSLGTADFIASPPIFGKSISTFACELS